MFLVSNMTEERRRWATTSSSGDEEQYTAAASAPAARSCSCCNFFLLFFYFLVLLLGLFVCFVLFCFCFVLERFPEIRKKAAAASTYQNPHAAGLGW